MSKGGCVAVFGRFYNNLGETRKGAEGVRLSYRSLRQKDRSVENGEFSNKSDDHKRRRQQLCMGLVRNIHASWYRPNLYRHHKVLPDFTFRTLVEANYRFNVSQRHT